MRKLLRYLRHYKKESILGPLFKMTEAIFELFVPIVMAKIVDIGIYNKDVSYILKMGGILVLLGILGLTCSLTAQYFAAKAAVGFGTELRNDMYKHINQFSYQELDTIGTSALVTRITNDINQTQTAVNLALRLFLRSPFIVIGAVIMAFTIDVKLAFIFVVLVPALSLVIFGIMGYSIPLYKKVQRELERVMLTTRENLTGVRVVRAFSKQAEEEAQFKEQNERLKGLQLFVGKISALLNPFTYIIVNVAIIIVLWFGGKTVNAGGITQGELIALVNYMTQILIALVAFANLIINFMKGVATAARVNEVFEIQPTVTEGETKRKASDSPEMMVQLKNVDFTYNGSRENALSKINLQVRRGETVGIIGGTGSGKSTLVHLIAGFYNVTGGTREVFSHKISIVPQQAVLFLGTLRDNMKWGNEEATDEQIYAALKTAQAINFVEQKGEGLDFLITQGGKNLSGGQKQRLTIARALVSEPEILILDDSASALDFATDAALRRAIGKDTSGMTVFFVSQRASAIKNANQIIVLDDGEIVGTGTHEQLMENCAVYEEICLSQWKKSEVADNGK